MLYQQKGSERIMNRSEASGRHGVYIWPLLLNKQSGTVLGSSAPAEHAQGLIRVQPQEREHGIEADTTVCHSLALCSYLSHVLLVYILQL